MTEVRHIIFDLDGTLVDSAPLCADIVNEMLWDRGSKRSVSPSEARLFLTRGGHQLVSALLGDECGDVAVELADFRNRYVARPTPPECLFPGVAAGLRHLAKLGVRMAICSNKPQHLCEKIVRDLGLSDSIPVIVGSRPNRPLKPDAHLARIALSELEAAPGRCVFVGDSEVDFQTAAAAGVPFLFVAYGYAEPEFEAGNVPQFGNFDEFVQFVSAPPDHILLPQVA